MCTKMKIEQGLGCVEVSNVNFIYSEFYVFLKNNFGGFFYWSAFEHKFYINDGCMGRYKTMALLRRFKEGTSR